jgi:cellulose synthase (UDP-forming)
MLYIAESYGILIHILGILVNVWPTNRLSIPLPSDETALPSVDVFIPTFNESPELVEITVTAASQMTYPREKLKVYLLDDGGTRERMESLDPAVSRKAKMRSKKLKALAAELGAVYQTRESNRNAKAGNLNAALFHCECRPDNEVLGHMNCVSTDDLAVKCGQLVLVLDCDHVPTRDFLQNTVGFFLKDPKLFLVQTPHHFINPGPVEKNLDIFGRGPSDNEMFYGVIQRGLDFWNSSFFCGSAALLRRDHLIAVGGFSSQTITEDVETSLSLHARGLNSIYLYRPMVIGLSPDTYDNFIIQHSRWAQGMTQILRMKNPLLQKGLTIAQRIGYFNSCFFWFFGLARIVFFLSPMFFLFFGLRIYNASLLQVVAYGLPHLVASYFVANMLYGRYRHPFFSEIYETVQSIYLAPAVLSAFFKPRSPVFRVTPKAVSLKKDFLSHLALPFYWMVLLCVCAQVVGWIRWNSIINSFDALFLCSLWNVFNLALLLCCLGVVWERKQRRKDHRFNMEEKAMLSVEGADNDQQVLLTDLSASGFSCQVDAAYRLFSGDRFRVLARDSYGEAYDLPARVVSRRPGSNDTDILGCEFILDTADHRRKAVAYVFGDSQRWRFFGERSTGPAIPVMQGFLKILGLGIRGSAANFAGIFRLSRDLFFTTIRYFKTSFSERRH